MPHAEERIIQIVDTIEEMKKVIVWLIMLMAFLLLPMEGKRPHGTYLRDSLSLIFTTAQAHETPFIFTTSDKHDADRELLRHTQVGCPCEGIHLSSHPSSVGHQPSNRREQQRQQRLLCFGHSLICCHRYRLSYQTCLEIHTLRHVEGADIYGRCQMRC